LAKFFNRNPTDRICCMHIFMWHLFQSTQSWKWCLRYHIRNNKMVKYLPICMAVNVLKKHKSFSFTYKEVGWHPNSGIESTLIKLCILHVNKFNAYIVMHKAVNWEIWEKSKSNSLQSKRQKLKLNFTKPTPTFMMIFNVM